MKKVLFSILVVLAIALAACSASSTGAPMGSTSSSLPVAAQLAVGTLKLADTDQVLTAEQAKDLVVYWETYKQLSQSDTAAQAEFDGLIAQIEETLTAVQMQSITAMNITQQDVVASMQGVTVITSNAGNSTAITSSGPGGGTGMPAGGPPADGGGTPPDGGMTGDMGGAASASSTSQTQSSQPTTSGAAKSVVPTALVEAVIQSLQQIIAA